MKKAFAILLAICMMIPVFAVSTFAVDNSEATEIDKTIPTVYVASTGSDATTDGTNRNTPFKTFEAAYNAVIANNTTGKAKIVLIGDALAFADNATEVHKLGSFSGTVYVCGEYNETAYPTLDFTRTDKAGGTVILLGANMVFYDLTLKNTYGTSNQNIWFATSLYDLTFGFNITHSCKSVPITGSVWNGANASHYDKAQDGATISIYSGDTYGTVICGNRSNLKFETTETITLNVYGGKYSSILSRQENTPTTATTIINIYGIGKSAPVKAPTAENSNDHLNIYNNVAVSFPELAYEDKNDSTKNVDNLFYDNTNVVKYSGTAKLTAPSYAVNYCGVQDKNEGEKLSVRLVGTVDSLEFDYIGFEIDINGVDYSNTSKRVYTSIQGADTEYSAAQLGSNYIYTRTITGLPKTGTITFKVRPFIWIGDSETGVGYYGQDYTVTYVNGELQK